MNCVPTVQRQAADQGAEFQRAEVQRLEAKDRFWSVVTDEEQHLAKAVIVATGSTLKELGVPGEEKLMGRGVSHCASCDGPLYDGQVVGVVGGGDSALQEALTLSNFAESVLVFDRDENFAGQHSYLQRVLSDPKIAPRYRTVIEEVLGDDQLTGVRVRNLCDQRSFSGRAGRLVRLCRHETEHGDFCKTSCSSATRGTCRPTAG